MWYISFVLQPAGTPAGCEPRWTRLPTLAGPAQLMVGRDPACDLAVSPRAGGVSRNHCTIGLNPLVQTVTLKQAGSNWTFVSPGSGLTAPADRTTSVGGRKGVMLAAGESVCLQTTRDTRRREASLRLALVLPDGTVIQLSIREEPAAAPANHAAAHIAHGLDVGTGGVSTTGGPVSEAAEVAPPRAYSGSRAEAADRPCPEAARDPAFSLMISPESSDVERD
ncbi:hypothetical protein H696_03903 [Fonticula alba]|uniref:FHA domain-containing protein n=1 Tax=Fonticula alba TaxID=691883 RepID=A0A058Z5E3_FONAL|nr:hypothetical protein H696_03903 [Fonticula alba]KCV69474.1 hypothetical protein H696_03903 [Fonticula alba]|eukprot:XP_009496039.1 hypothetical protein H696_03903 [Fonticula alba]